MTAIGKTWILVAMVSTSIAICLLMAFVPGRDQNIASTVIGTDQDIELGLPIGKENNFTVASGYGERMHPVLHVRKLHTGIDLVAAEGVPVIAAEGGVVVKAHLAHAWGNIVVIRHDDQYSTSYSHLREMNVKVGERVAKGQRIGSVGNTGLSEKFHLHFEVLKEGAAVDPSEHLSGL